MNQGNGCGPTPRADEHSGPFGYARRINSNGAEAIRRRCLECGNLVGPALDRARFTTNEINEMDIVDDLRGTRPPCVRCGAWGTEEHHWAPRSLFGDEADLWPTAWLCVTCHRRWHDTTEVATGAH